MKVERVKLNESVTVFWFGWRESRFLRESLGSKKEKKILFFFSSTCVLEGEIVLPPLYVFEPTRKKEANSRKKRVETKERRERESAFASRKDKHN